MKLNRRTTWLAVMCCLILAAGEVRAAWIGGGIEFKYGNSSEVMAQLLKEEIQQ
jgi:hypothetical protein